MAPSTSSTPEFELDRPCEEYTPSPPIDRATAIQTLIELQRAGLELPSGAELERLLEEVDRGEILTQHFLGSLGELFYCIHERQLQSFTLAIAEILQRENRPVSLYGVQHVYAKESRIARARR